ncbi:MAG: flagellar basal body rod protein FlgC [Burkholderiaceae bacterium]|jgi:flagellar basal-body rod protein FlgC|nr:flagellar basal body rod protein FlgC [Burkholderiaceae bacterium]
MSLFDIFNVSGSAMSAQSQRLNVVASNIANADSATSATGRPYRAKQVVFQPVKLDGTNNESTGVKVEMVVEDASEPRLVYDPKHPAANAQGYVSYPNVNLAEEMVNMLSASRSYQSNVETMNAAKTMLLKTLTIGS